MQNQLNKLSISARKMFTLFAIFIVSIVFLISSAIGVALVANNENVSTAYANVTPPTEPTNCTSSSTPTFNGYPTNMDNPNVDPTLCQDIPLLSFHSVEQGNPRSKSIQGPTNFQLTYINSATIGDASKSIANPKVAIQVEKVSETQYKMSSQLTADNAATYSSSTEGANGGDLLINVPSGYKLRYVQRSARHFDNNIVRDYQSKFGDGQSPFDYISDNGNNSNPIFTSFEGQTLGSSTGFNLAADGSLESGFLPAGYVLFTLDIEPVVTNLPPVLTGQEITIIRGQSGNFTPLSPTDPDNDTPISLEVLNALGYCTPSTVATGTIISCTAIDGAPKRAEFTITPTDSRGLSGAPATFIVNILDPGLNVVKSCVKKDTQINCADANLVPGDQVTYNLNLTNTGETDLTNVVMVDDYDQTKLTNITNINPPASNTDANNGVITWNLGTIPRNGSALGSFDATVSASITQNTTILNTVTASADGVPSVVSRVEFPVVIPNTPPQIPGQEITIVRGQDGSFAPLNPTDPENDTPISLAITNGLGFCTPTTVAANTVINCTTDENTPVRSEFVITPTDSRGLVGTPGTFIVNVIDPGLNITKDCYTSSNKSVRCENATIYPGDEVYYVLNVTNNGDTDLTNVVVTDDYNQSLVNTPNRISPAQSTLDETNGVITWNLGTIQKDAASTELTYYAQVKDSLTTSVIVENIATVDSDQTPPTTVRREFPVAQNLPPQIPGQTIIIIRGENGSFNPLNPTDPENDTPISLDVNNLPEFCQSNGQVASGSVITCDAIDGAPKTSTFTITPTDSKGLVGTPGTFVVRIIDPGLNIIKSCINEASTVCANQLPGDVVRYTINVVNNGEVDLTNVVVVDDFDQRYLSNFDNISSADGVLTGDTLTWNVGDLAINASKEFSFTAVVKEEASNQNINNIATVDSDQTEPKKDEYNFDVVGNPALSITKECKSFEGGKECKSANLTNTDTVVYTLTVKNVGDSVAKLVRIIDDYDQTKLRNVVIVNPDGTIDTVNGILTWNLGNLEAGATVKIEYQAQIVDGLAHNTIIENVATASGDKIPPVSTTYNFPIVVNPPKITLGRTGGIAILASWGTIFSIAGAFFFFGNTKKFAGNFVPNRTREDK